MTIASLRVLRPLAVLFASILPVASTAGAQSAAISAMRPAAQTSRVSGQADFGPQTQLTGHLPRWVSPATQASKSVSLSDTLHLSFVLQRDPAVQAAFTKFLADQQTPGSAVYHEWLTPEQVGTLFGPTTADVAAVTGWLTSQGLTVQQVSNSRTIIDVTGSTAAVSSALRTSFAYFTLDNEARLSAISEPSVPTALASVIQYISGLTDLPVKPQHIRGGARQFDPATTAATGSTPSPLLTTTGGSHYLVPRDFYTIYDIPSVLAGTNTGATIGTKAQHVAIIGRSRVALTDISEFATNTAIASYTLNTIIPTGATDPGTAQTGDQDEATLDVDRVIGTAPGAIADLVVATNNSGGIQVAVSYNVNTLLDPIETISFGACEYRAGSGSVSIYDSLFSTGAAEGISTFVSSGDSGANGCQTSFSPVSGTYPNSINYICASTYDTCVGGTEFAEGTGTYWNTANGTGYSSALSYIPEGGWNEPSTTSNGATTYAPASSGGGPSLYVAKPTWQVASGVPADGARDTPDVAFSSAGHDGYYACLDFALNSTTENCTAAGGGYFFYFSGTSASAPGMAGVAALINTAVGKAQGNLNPLIYKLYGTTPAAFHDTTVASSGVTNCAVTTPSMCNNSTPAAASLTGGQSGYLVGTGYDLVTGLGSLDVAKFIAAAVATTSPTVSTTTAITTASPNPASTTQTVTLTATITPANTTPGAPTGGITFYSNGVMIGTAPTALTGTTATITTSFAAAGTYLITATYSGDSNYITSTSTGVNLVVNATPIFNLSATAPATTYVSGTALNNTTAVKITSVNSFAGTVALTCSTSGITGATCALTPTSAAVTANGTASSTLSITAPAGTFGTLTVTINGVSGTLTASTTAAFTVALQTFTFAPAPNPAALTVVSGTTGAANVSTITLTSAATVGYAGTVALACSGSNPSGTVGTTGTCTISPATVTLVAGGTATATMTVTSAVGTAGSFVATVTGTTNYAGAIPLTVAVPVAVTGAGFTLSTPANLSFTSGATTGNTTTSLVTSTSGFAGTVNFSCTILGGAPAYPPTCSATSVTLTAGGTGTTTVTIGSTTKMSDRSPAQVSFGLRSGAATLASLFFLVAFRRRKAFRALAVFALLAIGLSAVSGCSGGGSAPSTPKSSAGSYTVTLSGTGTTTGATVSASNSTTFSLTIN